MVILLINSSCYLWIALLNMRNRADSTIFLCLETNRLGNEVRNDGRANTSVIMKGQQPNKGALERPLRDNTNFKFLPNYITCCLGP